MSLREKVFDRAGLRGKLNAARFTSYCEYRERKLVGTRFHFPKDVADGQWDLIRIGRSLYVIVANVTHKRQRVLRRS